MGLLGHVAALFLVFWRTACCSSGGSVCALSHVQLSVTPWTVAYQALLCMGFPKQEYWSGVPFPPPGDLPYPGIEPASLASAALAGKFFTTMSPGMPI